MKNSDKRFLASGTLVICGVALILLTSALGENIPVSSKDMLDVLGCGASGLGLVELLRMVVQEQKNQHTS